MKYAITKACEALEAAIEEVKQASVKAGLAGDRMAERNLGVNYRLRQLRDELKTMRGHEEYIVQPRFEKYFVEELPAAGDVKGGSSDYGKVKCKAIWS